GERERLVLAKDGRFEGLELRAGLDAQLLDERLPCRAVRRQSVRLPSRAVEREHELSSRTLAERVALDERLELEHELGVPAQGEVGLDSLLERDGAELLEPGDLGLRERLVRKVGECRTAPQGKGVA